MKIIAVDFDGCLCENRWPEIGPPIWPTIHALQACKEDGDRLILWTCREGDRLDEAVMWCANRGLTFDAVNDNLPEMTERFNNNCRKVFAHEYWDDRAVAKGDCWYSWLVGQTYAVRLGKRPNGLKERLRFLFTGRS